MDKSFIFYIVAWTIMSLTILLPVFLSVFRKKDRPTPLKRSCITLGLLLLNWVIFSLNIYGMLPFNLGNIVCVPIWWLLSVLGIAVGIFEWKNNKVIAIPILGITSINGLFSLLLYHISTT